VIVKTRKVSPIWRSPSAIAVESNGRILGAMRPSVLGKSPISVTRSTTCVFAVCAAEILSLAGYSIIPALLPQLIDAWSLDGTQAGWLAGVLSGGYMLGVIPLVAATDRIPARTVYLASAALSTISTFGLAFSDALGPALVFRALTGLGLAGMYMPGLRALADGIGGARRARVAALYTSSFTVGAALSFLLGRGGIFWGWRAAFLVAAVASLAGFAIAWVTMPRPEARPSPTKTFFPLRAVLQNRDAVILIIAYAATIWGAVGLRQWIVVFLGFCAGEPTHSDWTALAVAALINLLGVPAGLWGNELAIRFGLRFTAILIFIATAIVAGGFGFAALLPLAATAIAALIVGFVAAGNFSNLTSGLLAVAVPRYAGATMALYSCIGFGGGFVGTVLFGFTLDGFDGPSQLLAWITAFGTSGIACLIGAAVSSLLSRDVERGL
jgi:predicted MFS family arabinose efflux permease